MARGVTVISRTGETTLEVSAIRAVDGDPSSAWATPTHDLPQSMTIALPARSRIDKVGIVTARKPAFGAGQVMFERTVDGSSFMPLRTIVCARTNDPQWFDVTPSEATGLRVTILDDPAASNVHSYSILARGTELEAPHLGDISGCWTINGYRARFARRQAHVTGVLELGRQPLQFDGDFDGRTYRLSWIRGNDYGLALFTVSPDSRHLSGIEWHEEAIPLFYGDSWFGAHGDCSPTAYDATTPVKLLQRTGRYSLFGIRFRDDGSIDATESTVTLARLKAFLATATEVRLVAHEFRRPDAAANRNFAQRELDALRQHLERSGAKLTGVTFVNRGSDNPRQAPFNELQRALYSTIDLEIRK